MKVHVLVAACAFAQVAALVCALGSTATAQAPVVAWDSLGLGRVDAFAILPGSAADGSSDILVALGGIPDAYVYGGYVYELVRLLPGDTTWREYREESGGFAARDFLVTASGTLLAAAYTGPTHVARSSNGGRTWEKKVVDTGAECLFQSANPALANAIYACGGIDETEPGPNRPDRVWRSLSDGAAGTWEPLGAVGPPGGPTASFITALAELPPTPALPDGRLVVGVASGIAVSDDGGHTWTVSRLWENFHWWVYSLALAVDPAHPYGGTLLAGVGDFVQPGQGVWSSDDGGMTWVRRVTWTGLGPGDQTRLAAGPGGAVYAATDDLRSGVNYGTVHRTVDSGRTWEDLSGPGTGWGGYGSSSLHVGRDGRVYAATDAGVWATRTAVPVAGEAEPETPDAEPHPGVSVRPNPASGRTEVVLTLAEAQTVRVSVFDVQGREVAVLLDGAAPAGEQRLGVDTSTWPAGVYVVRASAGTRTATARLVVAR